MHTRFPPPTTTAPSPRLKLIIVRVPALLGRRRQPVRGIQRHLRRRPAQLCGVLGLCTGSRAMCSRRRQCSRRAHCSCCTVRYAAEQSAWGSTIHPITTCSGKDPYHASSGTDPHARTCAALMTCSTSFWSTWRQRTSARGSDSLCSPCKHQKASSSCEQQQVWHGGAGHGRKLRLRVQALQDGWRTQQ